MYDAHNSLISRCACFSIAPNWLCTCTVLDVSPALFGRVRVPCTSLSKVYWSPKVGLSRRQKGVKIMYRRVLIRLSIACVTVIAVFIVVCLVVSAQNENGNRPAPPRVYNPYPPGILPPDLVSETERVRREVNLIFQQALAEWRSLPPPTLTGQPPTLQGTGYQMVQTLGKLMNFDENMSPFRNRACGFCHMPYAGFSGPIPSVNLTMVAYPGSFEFRAGKRTAQ